MLAVDNRPMRFVTASHQVSIDIPDQAALLAAIAGRYDAKNGFALATLNLDHLVKLGENPSFSDAYAAQDFVVADGNPIVWVSRLAGTKVALLPGSDLIRPLAKQAALLRIPVALVGSTEAALASATRVLTAEIPGLEIVCQIAPPMGFDPASAAADAVLQDVQSSGARLVFLALGAPKQEILAARGRQATPDLGFVSIGAGLDFIAGHQSRAPAWVRRLALEWLWRMLSDPRRLFVRYVKCAAILPGLAWSAWRQRA